MLFGSVFWQAQKGVQGVSLGRASTASKPVGLFRFLFGHKKAVSYTHLDVYKRQVNGVGQHALQHHADVGGGVVQREAHRQMCIRDSI